ncbi:MAG: M3 family oligoendopeptidase [Anaerolineales bacterium]|nr:MAG: M3 family oligoendopeptidase [Anaerolineales bacterium]
MTSESLADWMEAWSDLRKLVDERYARLGLATELDTADQEAERLYHEFLGDIYPATQSADQKLKEKLLLSELVPKGMELALKKMRTEADLFREENLPLMTEESKLGTEYSKILGSQTVEWDGEEQTLTQIKAAMLTPDRDKRKKLWELMAERHLEDRDAINQLWGKFMDIRIKLASNAGYPDYRSYRWQQKLRLDYSPAESKQFTQAIKEVVVPAATRVYDRYKSRLGIDQVRPWDLINNQTTFSLPAIQAFETEEEFISRVGQILKTLDPVLGKYYDTMRENQLFDLMNRKGKGPGGFCTLFATVGLPFIFMNATGRNSDLRVLFHESGHAFHVFERKNLPYHHQWREAMEFAEVASTAMELLSEPYLAEDKGGFMSVEDAARTRLLNLEEKLLFWPYMAVVVAFQHWVYENQDLAKKPDACDSHWADLIDHYMPGINWEGYEEVKKTGWHRKLHIHQEPFYYIEYGLASLGAFQIMEKARKDQAKTLQDYRQALALGGTVPLPDLYRAAGANLSFDAGTLGAVVELIEGNLVDLENKLAN